MNLLVCGHPLTDNLIPVGILSILSTFLMGSDLISGSEDSILTVTDLFYIHMFILVYCISILVYCSYFAYFLSSKTQATLGQRLMRIRTIKLDYSKISLGLAFNRTLSQFLFPVFLDVIIAVALFVALNSLSETDFIETLLKQASRVALLYSLKLLLICLWYLIACFSKRKQTVHDMLFNTVVVVVDKT